MMIGTSFSDFDPSPRYEIKRKHSNGYQQHDDLDADQQERSIADPHHYSSDAHYLYFI